MYGQVLVITSLCLEKNGVDETPKLCRKYALKSNNMGLDWENSVIQW